MAVTLLNRVPHPVWVLGHKTTRSGNVDPDPIDGLNATAGYCRVCESRVCERVADHPAATLPFTPISCVWLTPLVGVIWSILIATGQAATVSYYETELLYRSGQYEKAARIARQQFEQGVWNERWPELLIDCHLTLGNYHQAVEVFQQGFKRFGERLPYRMAGYEVYRHVNRPELAREQLDAIESLVSRSPWRYRSMRNQVTLGRYFRIRGEDARQVLELLYDPVRREHPKYPEVYLATAELALEKHDYALAAEQTQQVCELQPNNPEAFYLHCLAVRHSDSQAATAALNTALQLNARHIPSLLLQADQLIDAEQYAEAEAMLTRVLTVNLSHPLAWAYHATIAHLLGHYQGEQALCQAALSIRPNNHEVEHLIGRKLSQKYRFREGAAYQRRALAKQPDFLPAKFQLASDLLRLGQEEEGWALATDVQQQDNYHVEAFNLAQLKDRLDQFRTLRSDHFIVQMDVTEAEVYGQQVLQLLERSYEVLVPKYGVTLDRPVHVEIFPRQQDFAIRTFGLPGGAGYLGVCFGPLITANSPVAQGAQPTNWQSILWHEFCHVVTLQKTKNRMPRWLSEGISVYEERLRNPGWGQDMTPRFRELILSDELTPVSELSGAFLRPKSPEHLQFAYYESSLVVEYLIEQVGMRVLQRILDDLSVGMPINEALQRYLGSAPVIDKRFTEFARKRANEFGDRLNWDRAPLADSQDRIQRRAQLAEHPDNYWLLTEVARDAMQSGNPSGAQQQLQHIFDLEQGGAACEMILPALAETFRLEGNEEREYTVLQRYARFDTDAIEARQRLMELARQQSDWQAVHQYAHQLLAINPMIASAQAAFLQSAKQLDRPADIVAGQRALLALGPPDPAAAHYQMAQALDRLGQTALAKRHTLMALEAAPRYRDAHRLLLQLIASKDASRSGEEQPTEEATSDAGSKNEPSENPELSERGEKPQ